MGSCERLQKELFAERTEGMNDCVLISPLLHSSRLSNAHAQRHSGFFLPGVSLTVPFLPIPFASGPDAYHYPLKLQQKQASVPTAMTNVDEGQSGNMVRAEFLDLPKSPHINRATR